MQSLLSICRTVAVSLLMLCQAGPGSQALAQPAADPAFERALAYFNGARNGDADQLDAAIAAFQAAPGHPALAPLFAAYLGSARTLQGKAAWLPWKKLKLTEQGLDQIDQALAALRPEHDQVLAQGVPVSLATRLAAATFIAVPDGLFHRRANGKALLGEASTGDIATLTWGEDYDGQQVDEEIVDGIACRKLDLVGQRKGVNYPRVMLYLAKKDHHPVQAELYVASDKVAKLARFQLGKVDGRRQVTAMTLIDHLQKDRTTEVHYLSRTDKTLSDDYFNAAFLVRADVVQ